MKKKILCVFLCMIIILNITISNYQYVQAAQALPYAMYYLYELLFSVGVTYGSVEMYKNWENLPDEEKQIVYNQDKARYEDFQKYYDTLDKSAYVDAKIIDSSGMTYYLDDMLAQDFYTEEEFDDMKKKSKKQSDWWRYSDELLDLLDLFFNDEEDDDNFTGTGDNQSYYQDDSFYIDRKTGEFHVFAYSKFRKEFTLADSGYVWGDPYDYIYLASGTVKEKYRDDFRICFGRSLDVFKAFPYVGATSSIPYSAQCSGYRVQTNYALNSTYIDGLEVNNYIIDSAGSQLSAYSAYQQILFCYYDSEQTLNYKNYWYLSSNVPFFSDWDSMQNYKDNGTADGAINLAPGTEPTPTSVPDDSVSNSTAVTTYCNSLKGKWINSTIINNYVTNLTNYCEENNITVNNTDSDYVDAVKRIANDDFAISLTPTNPPYDGYEEDKENDGDGFSLWKLFEWLLDFFTLDFDLISNSLNFDFIPAGSFDPVREAFDNMKSVFGTDTYIVEEETASSDINSSGEIGETSDSLVATSQQEINANTKGAVLDADYPVISFKCPKILDKYLETDCKYIRTVDGEKAIIICDFEDYAIHFVRFRAFMIAVLWIGMIFYILRELRVKFVVS